MMTVGRPVPWRLLARGLCGFEQRGQLQADVMRRHEARLEITRFRYWAVMIPLMDVQKSHRVRPQPLAPKDRELSCHPLCVTRNL